MHRDAAALQARHTLTAPSVLAALAVSVAATGCWAGSAWEDPDAASLGRGGVTALTRLDLCPGAPVEAGSSFAVSGARPFAGAAIAAGALRARVAREAWAAAVSIWQLRSPVHRETAFVLSGQLRAGALHAGAGVELREASFEGYTPRRDMSLRLGIGATVRGRTHLALALAGLHSDPDEGGPRLVVAAEVPLAGSAAVAVQREHDPGLPSRTLVGASFGRDFLHLLAGQDVATGTSTAGIELAGPHLRLAWAVSSHPELGMSQVWTCDLRH